MNPSSEPAGQGAAAGRPGPEPGDAALAGRPGPAPGRDGETPEQATARRFGLQALACAALGSTLYSGLLTRAAADLVAGGPTARVLAGHLQDHGASALPLRLLGGVHALVLTGQAAELAEFYPSAGGTADAGEGAELAWPAMRRVLASQGEQIRGWLDSPPQTNEVGRGAVLAGALCHLVAQADLPIRLFEVGASAGLNLRADKFLITGPGVSYGPRSSPVRLVDGWLGTPPPVRDLRVIERYGGDLMPVDPASADGQLRLTAFVWPDQAERLSRLRGAFELAAQVPAELRAEPASATVAQIRLVPGTWTVLWHSIMYQYLDRAEAAAIEDGVAALGAAATESARFAHVSLELVRRGADTPVDVVTWPGGVKRELGTALPHGIPVTWTSA